MPLVGTWIEMLAIGSGGGGVASCPSWARGLKSGCLSGACVLGVVPLVGTWIEMTTGSTAASTATVVPLVGTWIEIWRPRSGCPHAGRAPRGHVD